LPRLSYSSMVLNAFSIRYFETRFTLYSQSMIHCKGVIPCLSLQVGSKENSTASLSNSSQSCSYFSKIMFSLNLLSNNLTAHSKSSCTLSPLLSLTEEETKQAPFSFPLSSPSLHSEYPQSTNECQERFKCRGLHRVS
jgi:hypothetical protein